MIPSPLRETADIIKKMPGIGPRQALRCAFYILRNPSMREDLKEVLLKINYVKNCSSCFRYIQLAPNATYEICSLCLDKKRDKNSICVVEEDVDLEQLEKADAFSGQYFVLGGRLMLNHDPRSLRINELKQRVLDDRNIKEIIMAMSPTAEGNAAFLWLRQEILSSSGNAPQVRITRLGIGMPQGGEIEYADEETLRGALKHRS